MQLKPWVDHGLLPQHPPSAHLLHQRHSMCLITRSCSYCFWSESIFNFEMTNLELHLSLWHHELLVVFQAAAFTRSPDSLENLPPRARETTTTKAAAALTVSWATAGEAMDRRGAGGLQYPQTLGGRTRTNKKQGWLCGLRALWRHDNDTLKTNKLHSCFSLVSSLRFRPDNRASARVWKSQLLPHDGSLCAAAPLGGSHGHVTGSWKILCRPQSVFAIVPT